MLEIRRHIDVFGFVVRFEANVRVSKYTAAIPHSTCADLETQLHLFCPFSACFKWVMPGTQCSPIFSSLLFVIVLKGKFDKLSFDIFDHKSRSDPQNTAFLCRELLISKTTGCPKVTFKMLLDRSVAGRMITFTIFTRAC